MESTPAYGKRTILPATGAAERVSTPKTSQSAAGMNQSRTAIGRDGQLRRQYRYAARPGISANLRQCSGSSSHPRVDAVTRSTHPLNQVGAGAGGSKPGGNRQCQTTLLGRSGPHRPLAIRLCMRPDRAGDGDPHRGRAALRPRVEGQVADHRRRAYGRAGRGIAPRRYLITRHSLNGATGAGTAIAESGPAGGHRRFALIEKDMELCRRFNHPRKRRALQDFGSRRR